MKKLICFILLCANLNSSFSQTESSVNQEGLNFTSSLKTIINKLKKGEIQNVDQETINLIKSQIPTQADISIVQANLVLEKYKSKNLNIYNEINNSNFSSNAKELLKRTISFPNTASLNNYYANLTQDINNSNLESGEKLTIATINSIVSNIQNDNELISLASNNTANKNENPGCYMPNNNGEIIHVSAGGCVSLGFLAGFLVGYSTCGIWCGLGGGLLFGVLVATSVC